MKKETYLKEIYLGDGLYASFDGFQIILRAPKENGDHFVMLEPDVYKALQEFVMNMEKKAKTS